MLLDSQSVFIAAVDVIATGPRISGSLEPRERAAVRAEVGGQVLQVRAEVGQRVRRGDLLARIEDRALRDAVVSAQAAVRSATEAARNARRQAERTRRLVAGGALPERDVETARSQLALAEAQLAEARARLVSARQQRQDAIVRAPMTGSVSERGVGEGDVVAPGALLFSIIDPRTMRLEGSVPSDAVAAVRVGAPVTFTVRGYPEQTFTGTIERIAPEADPATRQIPVIVDLPNPGGRLLAGLFAEGQVASERRRAIIVPLAAVDLAGPTPTVRRLRDGKVEQVAVKLGLRDETGERVAIEEGLEPGDRILVGPARTLAPGTPVQVAQGPAPGGR